MQNLYQFLSYVLPVKYLVEILQNFVAFSEYMNFTTAYNSKCVTGFFESDYKYRMQFHTRTYSFCISLFFLNIPRRKVAGNIPGRPEKSAICKKCYYFDMYIELNGRLGCLSTFRVLFMIFIIDIQNK